MQIAIAPSSHHDASIRWSQRKIPLSHGNHRCGRVAWTPPSKSIPVESKLEADWLMYLLSHDALIAVHSQPFTLSYRDEAGRVRAYTPDFLVVFDRLTRQLLRWGFAPWTVVEVKPVTQLERQLHAIRRRLEAVQQALGVAAVCLTDAQLPQARGA